MANSYKLSYTATQIDEKLGKIDSLVATVNGVSPDENGNVEIQVFGGNVDLTGYATEQYVKDYAQPKGNYLTKHQSLEGYAKTKDIPTKPEDIGAQPAGNYALKSEIPSVPVQSVNGKTGAVQLSASDVGARPSTWMPSASDVGALPNTTKIPAKTSDLTNDSGFITDYTETDPTVPAWAKNATKPSYTASEVGALPSTTKIPSKTSDLENDSGFITDYTETDPTVPSWAKASSKPSYSKSEVGLGNVDNVKQYSASNPPPYPVTSVNGETGAVSLTIPTVPTKVSAFENDKGYLTQHQDISHKLDANKLPEAVNTALAQAKASGEFDGAPGKTPVVGIDYWTQADREAIVSEVIDLLGGTPVFGTVDSNKNIILTGALAEGTYTIKYEDENGKVTEIGTLNHTLKTYANLFDPTTATLNKRMSASSNAAKDQDGYVLTALIPIPATSVTASSRTDFIAVPKNMWSGSANIYLAAGSAITQGMNDNVNTTYETDGNWAKIPLLNQWGNGFTCDGVVLSLHIKDSAISTSDIQNIEIYFNEIPE